MAQIWKCISDILDIKLGPGHRLAVSLRLDYIKRLVTDHKDEEKLLTGLFRQLKDTAQLSAPRVMLNLAHNLNNQGRHDEAEEMVLAVSSLLQMNGMYTSRVVEEIECLKIISLKYINAAKGN
jgi:hypothetical protein